MTLSTDRPNKQGESIPHLKAIIFSLLLASFLPSFAGSALNVAIPTIGAEFKSATADLGWIVASYTICCLTLALPMGRLADLTSRRAVLIAGIFSLSLAAGLTIFATSLETIILCRIAQGIGAACLYATTMAIVNQLFPPERRGQIIGISTAFVYIGLAAGPVLGGLLTHYVGWRGIFMFLMVFGFLDAVVAIFCMPKQQGTSRQAQATLQSQMDPLGVCFFAIAAVAVSVGLNLVSANALGWLCLAIGFVALLVFILHERRAKSPLIPGVLFSKGPNFLLSSLSALFNYSATFAVSYLVSLYLQQVLGFGAATAGLILIVAPSVQALVTPVSGRLSDRHSPFLLASVGMAICALGLISLVALTFTASLPHVFVSLAIVGLGFGIFSPPNTNAIMSQAPREHSGVASSFVSTMRNCGQMLSMAVITIVMTLTIGHAAITDVAPDSIALVARICCIIFTVLCIAGIFTSLQRRSK